MGTKRASVALSHQGMLAYVLLYYITCYVTTLIITVPGPAPPVCLQWWLPCTCTIMPFSHQEGSAHVGRAGGNYQCIPGSSSTLFLSGHCCLDEKRSNYRRRRCRSEYQEVCEVPTVPPHPGMLLSRLLAAGVSRRDTEATTSQVRQTSG